MGKGTPYIAEMALGHAPTAFMHRLRQGARNSRSIDASVLQGPYREVWQNRWYHEVNAFVLDGSSRTFYADFDRIRINRVKEHDMTNKPIIQIEDLNKTFGEGGKR